MEYFGFSGGMRAVDTSDHHPKPAFYTSNMPHAIGSCDVKPRLTKEQHDILEAHYQKQPKPNTNTKKGFAESLGVSLEKVNNWFQNRRAKTKQDAKKAAGNLNVYQTHQQNFHSDSDSSPYHTSPQYSAMMQQWSNEGQSATGLGISHAHQHPIPIPVQSQPFANGATTDQFENFAWHPQLSQDFYESPEEVNRRTLTQETFDAIARDGGMTDGYGQFEGFHSGFSGNEDILNSVFPEMSSQDFKQQDLAFPYPIGAPLSSSDSTGASTISEFSMPLRPSNTVQSQGNLSSGSSEWADSRSSSIAGLHHDANAPQITASHPQAAISTSQWQPGQSVPVDVDQLKEGFRQAAQTRADSNSYESAFPSDEAYARRGSQASVLANSMGNIGLNTPQTDQSGVFKSPAPPTNIAARRQRPRPAALGTASLRSQSCGQPGSPGSAPPTVPLTQDQQLRRIRSVAVMNSGVSQGRVMKSSSSSAQRSPLSFSFNDAFNSPNLVRHLSHGNLAPPTPMSPKDFSQVDGQSSQPSTAWRSSGEVSRQPSIAELDQEYAMPSAPVPVQNFSSPPHTPMYQQHSFVAQRVGGNSIMENTPPQSAPAGQSCFSSNNFPQKQMAQQPMQAPTVSQSQQFADMMVPDQQFQTPNVSFAPAQQANVTSGPPPGMPLQFANGIPMVNSEGNFKVSFPPQSELMQQQSQQLQSPSLQQFPFVTSSNSPGMPPTAYQTGQSQSELFVHEYSPPGAMKRSDATPRKMAENGPKNYTFTHAGPEHFHDKYSKKTDARDFGLSSSPNDSGNETSFAS